MIGVGTCNISDRAKKYVNEVLDSNRLSYGPFTQRFEQKFAAAHDCRFAIMSNSGTSSLLVSLAALKNKYGWSDGDEVIVPAVTFVATSNIVMQLNMTPVFVDVDPIFYELDPEKIDAAITSKTRCIIPVHLFGHPCEMDKITDLAQKRGLRIIEDSCETMFTRYQGKSVGSFGDIGCFSTYVAHILTTGVGGLSTTNDIDLATSLRSLINHGRDSIYISIDDDKGKSQEEFQMIVKRRFSFVQMGHSFRVTEMEGALGLAEFEEHESMMKARHFNGDYLTRKLNHLSDKIQLPSIRPGADHAFMMYPIVLRDQKKDELVQYLENNGIETRDMLPLINQPYYQEMFNLDPKDYPNAHWVNESGFYIASHQGLSAVEREYIVQTFDNFFSKKQVTEKSACLVVMAKFDGEVSTPYLQNFYDSLPLESFKELALADASKTPVVSDFFRNKGFKIIEGAGKSYSIHQAIQQTKSDHYVIIGLDGADDPKDIDDILIGLKNGRDMVIASRFMPGGGRQTDRIFSYRSIGNRFFSFLLAVIYNRNITDCNNIFRGMTRSFYESADLGSNEGNAMFRMTVKALSLKTDLTEIPTIEHRGQFKRKKQNRLISAISFTFILLASLFQSNKKRGQH